MVAERPANALGSAQALEQVDFKWLSLRARP